MGLLGCLASFQRLMEKVMDGITNILIYIDDIINHTQDHPEHLYLGPNLTATGSAQTQDQPGHDYLGTKEVPYLGFTLTPKSILPGQEKIKDLLRS